MARRKRSRSLASALLPSLFRAVTEPASESETETVFQTMVVFGFGRFQKLVLLCAEITTFVAYTYSFAVTTDLEPVEHWCRPSAEYSNMSAEAWKNVSVPRLPGSAARFNSCHRYETPLAPNVTETGADGEGDARVVVACDAWDYDTRMTGRTVVVHWNLVCDRAWYQQLLSAAFMCAGALSVPCAGLASNRWGRRPIMWASLGALLISGVVTPLAPTAVVFIALRFLSSAAVSALEVVAFVLLFESTPPGPREAFCALAVCWPTVLAPVYVGFIAYLALDWRICHAGLVAPALSLILTVYFTEESPHWLIVNKRYHEARRVALWAARINNEEPEVVIERLELVKEMLAARAGKAGTANCDQQEEQHPAAYQPRLRYMSRTVMAHCFVVFSCWFTLYVNYYYRNLNLPYISAVKWVIIAANVPAMTVAYFIIRHHGRREPLVVFLLAVSLLLLFQAATQFLGLKFPSQLGLMWRELLLNIAYVLLCVHTVALFPTQIRSVAFSGAYTFGRLGAMASEAFKVVEDVLPSDLSALPVGVTAVHMMVFSLLLMTLSEKALLDEVTGADSRSGVETPQRRKRKATACSMFPLRK
ncbi:solute carrier family 22 member 7-like [Amblyomma americanum]|uniref:Major facilitator superfamily (MFS) profile domain-containing protein n=1 Tax=Amblyomma americanum TaxID=6943 RepID=A0AAQ4DMK8_AMBAM